MSGKLDRVATAMAAAELDSLLVTHLPNVRWLTGFTGTNGAVVLAPEERVFVTDFRYTEQAEAQVDAAFERLPAERELASALSARLVGRAGFEDAHVSVRQHGKLSEKLPEGVEFVAAGDVLESEREIKEPAELEKIAAAARLADEALLAVLEQPLAGRTEKQVQRQLHDEILERGGDGPSFPAIVAAGPHGALPHAEPRDVEIPEDVLVVIDWGAQLDGWCSDCTRTYATGDGVPDADREVYDIVLRAQEAALAAVQPGASGQAVDGVARDIIEAAGHGEAFGHGLGHGVGLQVHEGPRLTKTVDDEIRAGAVVTVEPGIYLPGQVGVRIEDLVAVTADGHRVLSGLPKALTVA